MRPVYLRDATVLDGSGGEARRASLLLDGGKIASIGQPPRPADALVLDCDGLCAAPGLIDLHSHSDLQVLEGRTEKLRQGVTAELVGNCGFSVFPATGERCLLHEFANGILCGEGDWGFESARDYLECARRLSNVCVHALAGHGTLRVAHAGLRHGPLTEKQLSAMEQALGGCLDQGASGLSTGLMYHPGSSAPTGELERLCRVVAKHGALHATHMRDYSGHLPEAVSEVLAISRRTGCRLQISHLQAVGAKNWNKQAAALELIEEAAADGVDVAFDCYPYTAGSTVLTQFLPQWALDGGLPALMGRLRSPLERRRIRTGMLAELAHEWTDLRIAAVGSDRNRDAVGRDLAEIATDRDRDPADVVLDLLLEEHGEVTILEFNQSDPNLRELLTHPLAVVVSDGFYAKGKPHPRLFGAFAKFLGNVVREREWLSLPEAVHKITGAPALRLGLAARGLLKEGYAADVVVFDAAAIGSPATYENPCVPPTGIRWVIRDGRLALG